MPSGPKKRRAAAKKKEQPKKSVVERVEISNQKTPDVLSGITISEDVVDQCVLPPIADKVESEGVSSGLLTSIEPLENIEDEFFQESIEAVEKRGLENDLLTSDEQVEMIVEESLHEPKTVSEMQVLGLLMKKEPLENTEDEIYHDSILIFGEEGSEMVLSDLTSNDPVIVEETVEEVFDSFIKVVENAGSKMNPLDSVCSDDPVKNIIDEVIEPIENIFGEIEHVLFIENEKEESGKQVLGLLPINEPYRSDADGVDLDSIQTLEKEESEILTSDFLTRNDSVKNTIDEVVESIQAFENSVSEILHLDSLTSIDPVENTIKVVESNQAVEIAESETLSDHKASETIEDVFVGEEIMWNLSTAKNYDNNINLNPDYQVIVAGLTVTEQEISVSSKEKSNLDSSAVRETLIEENVPVPNDPETYNHASKIPKSDNQPLQELICSCNFGESVRISIQKKRVKKFLQEELMATEKWRLDLKKAIDQLVDDDDDAWIPDEADV